MKGDLYSPFILSKIFKIIVYAHYVLWYINNVRIKENAY